MPSKIVTGEDAPQKPISKKPRRESKPERSTRREERNAIMSRAKTLWEEMRPKAVDPAKTSRLVKDLHELLRGRMVEFVFRHDGSRIVQWMLSDGSDEQRNEMMDELLAGAEIDAAKAAAVAAGEKATDHVPVGVSSAPFFVRLANDRYGRHLAMKMLRISVKYTRHRNVIFETCLKGNAATLVRNAYGADVLDFAYQTTLNARQRAHLVVEVLFSREAKMLAVVLSKQAGGADIGGDKLTFASALKLCGDSFKDAVVESAGAALAAYVDKPAIVRLAIVHAALDDYLKVAMQDYPPAKTRELCGLLASSLVHLAHTKPGVACATACVKVLDAKHRKKVVRSLKGHVRLLVAEECGHRLLLAIMEWVDDTKLVGKALTAELFSTSKMMAEIAIQKEEDVADGGDGDDRGGGLKITGGSKFVPGRIPKAAALKGAKPTPMEEDGNAGSVDVDYLTSLFTNQYGRMIFINLLFPRSTRYFNPDLYGATWAALDEEKFGKMSKKDSDTRRVELWLQFSDAVAAVIRESCREMIMCHWSAPILIGSLDHDGLREVVTECLVSQVQAVVDETDSELVRSVCAQKTIGVVGKIGGSQFAEAVLAAVGNDVFASLGQRGGWAAAACALLNACQSRSASKAVIKAKGAIESAGGAAGKRLLGDAEALRNSKKRKT